MPPPTTDRAALTPLWKKTLVVSVLVLAGAVLFYVLRQTLLTPLLLLFAGILLAVLLGGLATKVCEHTPLSHGWALLTVMVTLVLLLGLFAFLSGPPIAAQAEELVETLPRSLETLREELRETPLGDLIVSNLPLAGDNGVGQILNRIGGIFSTGLGALTGLLVILFVGVYIAADPKMYKNSAVRLVPPDYRDRAARLLRLCASGLGWWLVGRFASMAVVGILVGVGLWIVDVPLAVFLGFLAALLSFIPYIGPALTAVPVLLVALTESGMTAVWAGVVLLVVQFLESYVITPPIQQRAVSLPPAMLIAAQVVMGTLAGALGVLVASPLMVVAIISVQVLYLQERLHEEVRPLGERNED